MSFSSTLYGAGMKAPSGYRQFQNFTPQQMQLYKQLFGHVGDDSFLSKLAQGDESMFADIEAPALSQFSGMQGQIASRFSGMGLGARNSSGFINSQNQAAKDFASQLQSQRQGLQRQAIQDLMSYSNQLLNQDPYSLSQKRQKQPSFLQSLALSGAQGFGQGMGGFITGGF
jgi:hypothetical protein